jgi:hypothetical protein
MVQAQIVFNTFFLVLSYYYFFTKELQYKELLAKNEKLQFELLQLQLEVSNLKAQDLVLSKSLEDIPNNNVFLYSGLILFAFVVVGFLMFQQIDTQSLIKGFDEKIIMSNNVHLECLQTVVNSINETNSQNFEKLAEGISRLDFVLNTIYLNNTNSGGGGESGLVNSGNFSTWPFLINPQSPTQNVGEQVLRTAIDFI